MNRHIVLKNRSLHGSKTADFQIIMHKVIQIDPRPNISEDIANNLRNMIFDGYFSAGERINEVHLSTELGVSRTPLREALTKLTAEEALCHVPRRGFFVVELSREEFEDIHPMRAILDPAALKLSGIPSSESFKRLEMINEQIKATSDFKVRASLDDEWHLELIANCRNVVLIGQIKLFMNRIRRYGLAFHQDRQVIEMSPTEHQEIIRALKRGDIERACEWLRRNLSSDKAPILEWLKVRKQ